MEKIYFKAGYKYQLTRDYEILTPIRPDAELVHDYFTLYPTGVLVVRKSYAWDGATWCPEWLVPPLCSMVHDALCQALKCEDLDYDEYALKVHGLLRDMVAKRKGKIASWAVFAAVTLAKGGHPDNSDDNPEITDP